MHAQQCNIEVVPDGEGYAVVAQGTNLDGGTTSVVLAWYREKWQARCASVDIEVSLMGYA